MFQHMHVYFPLNRAGLDDILGEDRENRLHAEIKFQRLHPSDQSTLAMAHRRKPLRQQRLVPAEPRPIA